MSRIYFLLFVLLFSSYDGNDAIVTETSSASASSSSDEYDDRLLTNDRNDSKNANDTLLRGPNVGPERLMRRDQSKDLKRLIQELEESDYSNYGSWGNFRSRPSPPPSSEDDTYRNSPDMTTVREHEVFWDDPVDSGSSIVHSDGPYRTNHYDSGRHHHGGFGSRFSGGGLSGRHYNQPPPPLPPHEYNPDHYNSLDEDDVAYQSYHSNHRQYHPSSSASWDYRDVVASSIGSTVAGNNGQRWEDSQSDEETRLLRYQPYQSHDDSPTHPMGSYHPQPPMIMNYREHHASRDRSGLTVATLSHSDALLSISRLDPKRELQFHSVLSLTSVLVFCALSAYLSVTPRLPSPTGSTTAAAGESLFDLFSSLTSTVHDSTLMSIYNHSFKEIFLRLLVGTFVWPWMVMMTVFRRCDADINKVIHTFVGSFTFGYAITVVVQMMTATAIRLVLLYWLEPTIFHLCPHIPKIFLPWQLRECQTSLESEGRNIQVHLRHTTKVVISVMTTCIIMPFLEEYMKLALFRWNFPVITADNDQSVPRTKSMHTPSQPSSPPGQSIHNHFRTSSIQPSSIPPSTTNPVRTCIIGILSASYGLKIADNVLRILSYNKLTSNQQHKTFFAILRGLFPIQELCGAMTAIRWVKFQQEQDLGWLKKQSSTASAVKPEDNHTSRKRKEESKGKGNVVKGEEATGSHSFDVAYNSASIPGHLPSTFVGTSKPSTTSRSLDSLGSFPMGQYRHRVSFLRMVSDILWPAITLHAMANFRGMKPLFAWSSPRPWQELQLQAWNAIDTSTPMQMLLHGGINLLWFLWLARLFAGVMKDYVAATQQHVHLQLQRKMQNEQYSFPSKEWKSSMQSALSTMSSDSSSSSSFLHEHPGMKSMSTNNNQPYQQQRQQQRQQYGRGPYRGQGTRSSSNNSPR